MPPRSPQEALGIFHGMKSYFCQDEYGQIAPVYSISAGLDYPGIGPEHAMLAQQKAVHSTLPSPMMKPLMHLNILATHRRESFRPSRAAHAVAYAMKLAPTMDKDKIIVITISGRGDKDCAAIARYRGEDIS